MYACVQTLFYTSLAFTTHLDWDNSQEGCIAQEHWQNIVSAKADLIDDNSNHGNLNTKLTCKILKMEEYQTLLISSSYKNDKHFFFFTF